MGCTLKVTSELLVGSQLRSLIMKDVKVQNIGGMLDLCINLQEFSFHSLLNADVLTAYNFASKTPNLQRLCMYTHFTSDRLQTLLENLPCVRYLEIGNMSFALSNQAIDKSLAKFEFSLFVNTPYIDQDRIKELQ